MPTTTKPTIILAPGSWYPASSMDPLAAVLHKAGYKTKTVSWPSVVRGSEVQSLDEDITALRALINPEVAEGREVVVLAHSWAGIPVGSGLEGLIKTEEGKGGVVKLLYVAAFLVEEGKTLVQTFGGEAPWYIKDIPNNTVLPNDPVNLFFHDVPAGSEWASKLNPTSWATTIAPATGAAYLDIPTSYLICEEDRALPLFLQDMMIEMARSNGAAIGTEKVKMGHSPWLVEGGDEVVGAWVRREAGEDI
ncbi:alpha/beta hydrolase [Aspergillus stella-maris]|uniref:alpha/beta hydrolase n=1 Tax=Aspergillus stella-maris TaxID=1810926 RepID=UPI003CCE1F59